MIPPGLARTEIGKGVIIERGLGLLSRSGPVVIPPGQARTEAGKGLFIERRLEIELNAEVIVRAMLGSSHSTEAFLAWPGEMGENRCENSFDHFVTVHEAGSGSFSAGLLVPNCRMSRRKCA